MSYPVKCLIMFLGALCVLFLSVFTSFRCGYSKGLGDAPRRFYSVDVANALRTNPDFRAHVDSIYTATYTHMVDSIFRTGEVMTLVGQWLDEHPDCQLKKERTLPMDKHTAEQVFFKGVKF